MMGGQVPRYLDVASLLQEEIGALAPNCLLPTEQQLAKRFGVSRITVRGALDLLERNGTVTRLRGRGTVVSPEKVTRTFSPLTSFEKDMERQGVAFTTDILSELVDSLEEFDLLSKNDFLMFLEPPSIDDRIVNQFALFSIISNPRRRLDEWVENHPHIYAKIVIPAELKWEVRDRLDQANITERVLFPGLDGLSSWLRRHYAPR